MSRRPSRPKRGAPPRRAPQKSNAFPSDFGDDGSLDEVDPLPGNDEHTTWVPSGEHLDPGEVTSWISGQSDTPDLPDFERTEAKGPRRGEPVGRDAERTSRIRTPKRRAEDSPGRVRPEVPRTGRSQGPIASPVKRKGKKKPIAEAPKRSRKKSKEPATKSPPKPRKASPRGSTSARKAPGSTSARKAPGSTSARKAPGSATTRKKRLPTPEPAPRRRENPIEAAEPTVRQQGPNRIPTGPRTKGIAIPKKVPPRRKHNANDEDSLTIPRPQLAAPPVQQPRPMPGHTPMPAPQRMQSIPRAGRSIPTAPPVPRPHGYAPASVSDPSSSAPPQELPGHVVARSTDPTASLPSTSASVDEVVPPLSHLPNDAPTVVRPELADPVASAPPAAGSFGASFADEPDQGEPTVALPPPSQRARALASGPPAAAPSTVNTDYLPGTASYSPPAAPAPPPRAATPAPATRSQAPQQSRPPAQAPQQSQQPSTSPRLPKGASVYTDDDDEGLNPLHVIYGAVGIIGAILIVGAVLLGFLALMMV